MDPIRSPISATAPSLAAAVQALQLSQGLQPADVEALLQAMGQELNVLFLGQDAEGTRLELPGGRIVTAQGELPFPEGTQLRIRVAAEGGALKLQTLEARPPGTPSVLAPLVQGEAAPLAARLLQASPAPGLEPLVQLMRTLAGVPAPSPQAALPASVPLTEGAAGRPSLPAAPLLAKAIAALPPEPAASLARALGVSDPDPEILAARLSARVERTLARAQQGPAEGLELRARAREADAVLAARQSSAVEEVLADFQALFRRTEMPQEHRGALDGWIRSLLSRSAPEGAAPFQPTPRLPRPVQGMQPQLESRILTQAESAQAEGAVKTHAGPAVQVPEAWEAWIKGSVRALADPEVSPREAPFHALQAKEGTAYFEIPLPWAGGQALQMWVEEDAPERNAPGREETRRVLLSLSLSQLGETRVGLQSSGNALSVRIWTEHPGMMESQRAAVERELADSGRAVDLRILPLNPGPDGCIADLRALVGGTNLHAMG